MATIKVFSGAGVKELRCFENIDDVPFLSDEDEDTIQDDGELTVSEPL